MLVFACFASYRNTGSWTWPRWAWLLAVHHTNSMTGSITNPTLDRFNKTRTVGSLKILLPPPSPHLLFSIPRRHWLSPLLDSLRLSTEFPVQDRNKYQVHESWCRAGWVPESRFCVLSQAVALPIGKKSPELESSHGRRPPHGGYNRDDPAMSSPPCRTSPVLRNKTLSTWLPDQPS
jgi:hypothetical protein